VYLLNFVIAQHTWVLLLLPNAALTGEKWPNTHTHIYEHTHTHTKGRRQKKQDKRGRGGKEEKEKAKKPKEEGEKNKYVKMCISGPTLGPPRFPQY